MIEFRGWKGHVIGKYAASIKTLSRKQLESRKAQAVRFTRDVREDDNRADEIEDESLEDYAQDRHVKLANPKGTRKMAVQTRRELHLKLFLLDNYKGGTAL